MKRLFILISALTIMNACTQNPGVADATRAVRVTPEELYVAEGGVMHIDLYDDVNKIPFDKIESFFNKNLSFNE